MQTGEKNLKRRLDFIGTGVTLLAVAAVVYGGWRSGLKKLGGLRAEQGQLTERLSDMTELETWVNEGEGKLAEMGREIARLDRNLPEEMGFQDFYSMLTEAARQTGILINEISPGPVIQNEARDYQEMSVSFSMTAGFEDFYRFLSSLSRLPRLNKLDYLSIGPSTDPELCDIEMTVKIYGSASSRT